MSEISDPSSSGAQVEPATRLLLGLIHNCQDKWWFTAKELKTNVVSDVLGPNTHAVKSCLDSLHERGFLDIARNMLNGREVIEYRLTEKALALVPKTG